MDKKVILLAWKHIKTLRGSNLGDYYCQFIHSGIEFDKDAVVIENMINDYFNLKDNMNVNIKTLEEKYKKSLKHLETLDCQLNDNDVCKYIDMAEWDELISYEVDFEGSNN